MEFTYKAYAKLINKLKSNEYVISDYESCDCYEKSVILRHDIDYSVDKALDFARVEHDLNVKSTYFVLVSSPFYNIVSNDTISKLKEIQSFGHDIGLHFDEANYNDNYYKKSGGIKNVIFKEIDILKNVLDMDIKSISMHRPSKDTLDADYDLSPYINSYGKHYFNDFKYVSDSRRRWREDVNHIIECNEYKKLHILTHAFWYDEVDVDMKETIKKFICTGNSEKYWNLANNINDLQSILKFEEI